VEDFGNMNDEDKINQLASQLYSKGLAGSMWDAKNKARDILGLNNQLKSYRSYYNEKEEKEVSGIMQDAGIKPEEVRKAEEEKVQQLIESVQKHFEQTNIREGKNEKYEEEAKAEIKEAVSEAAEDSSKSVEEEINKEKIPSVYFADSLEGAEPDMLLKDVVESRMKKQNDEEVIDIGPSPEKGVPEVEDVDIDGLYIEKKKEETEEPTGEDKEENYDLLKEDNTVKIETNEDDSFTEGLETEVDESKEENVFNEPGKEKNDIGDDEEQDVNF
jgi:hypothetical protein